MPIHIVRPGTARRPGEGWRIGTLRRPPRGVPRAEFASGDWCEDAPHCHRSLLRGLLQERGADIAD